MSYPIRYSSVFVVCLALHQFAPATATSQSLSGDIEALRKRIETEGAQYVDERETSWFINCFPNGTERRAPKMLDWPCADDRACQQKMLRSAEIPSQIPAEIDTPVGDSLDDDLAQ